MAVTDCKRYRLQALQTVGCNEKWREGGKRESGALEHPRNHRFPSQLLIGVPVGLAVAAVFP